jgi:prepilin-type N-terminal cleavage/methylation domain-containing protein
MKIKTYKYQLYSEQGFSLVELIIIIVIIGVLAAVAVAHYNDVSNSGKIAVCKANQFSIETAQKIYLMDHFDGGDSHFATSLEELRDYSCFQDDEIPVCPMGGTYVLLSGGIVKCSIPEHN